MVPKAPQLGHTDCQRSVTMPQGWQRQCMSIGAAVARVNKSALKELVISDTILATDATQDSDRIRILSIATLIGEAIRRIADESSVSSLFD